MTGVNLENLGRYLFAANYLRCYRPEQVADIACGSGYGLPELTQIAQAVVSSGTLKAAQRMGERYTAGSRPKFRFSSTT